MSEYVVENERGEFRKVDRQGPLIGPETWKIEDHRKEFLEVLHVGHSTIPVADKKEHMKQVAQSMNTNKLIGSIIWYTQVPQKHQQIIDKVTRNAVDLDKESISKFGPIKRIYLKRFGKKFSA